jgi:hypothetical protein
MGLAGHGHFASRPGRDSASNPAASDSTKDFYAEAYKLELDGTIVGRFGGADNPLGTFTTLHLMDCRHDDKIIAGYLLGWAKVIKLQP